MVLLQCVEDADCPVVPEGWDEQCVETADESTLCSTGECLYWVLEGETCTTASGQAGTCDRDAQCIAGCQVDDDCAGNTNGYAEGCYWYMCGDDGQCYYGTDPREPCKTSAGKQGQCTRQGVCRAVACPNTGAICYSADDCCSASASTRMSCLPNARGLLRCTQSRRGRQRG